MDHYVGLDVSLKTVFICIINEKGKVVKEQKLISTMRRRMSRRKRDYMRSIVKKPCHYQNQRQCVCHFFLLSL
jgi:hypothetical protein